MSTLPIHFFKVQAAGNDFVLVAADDIAVFGPERFAQSVCRRKISIGADGVILYRQLAERRFWFRFYNPDGSEAEICGNGVISFSTFLVHQGLAALGDITLDTKAGDLKISLEADAVVVNLGKPRFGLQVGEETRELADYPIAVADQTREISYVNVGNPHCSIFVDNLDLVDLAKEGQVVEHLPIFPDRVNTEFIQVVDRNNIIARFWERGAGETLASGSGASAAAVISIMHKYCESPVTVHTQIARLEVFWAPGQDIRLRGKGHVVYTGHIAP